MKTWSYYATQRWPVPGAIPREGLLSTYDFDERKYIPTIEKRAYGYAIYNRQLTEKEISDYELTPAPEMKTAD